VIPASPETIAISANENKCALLSKPPWFTDTWSINHRSPDVKNNFASKGICDHGANFESPLLLEISLNTPRTHKHHYYHHQNKNMTRITLQRE
jgi:hypothetical protein